ncbi:hypothetical protein D3D02_15860 [Halobellus sp. Atlit-38R]|nr:hypothetical protein D3D02_15860 [Halobellus sp. Atlit-38R]
MVMRLLSPVVLIMPIITTSLKCPAAVGEARMLQPPHDGASPKVETPRPDSSLLGHSSSEVEAMGEGVLSV